MTDEQILKALGNRFQASRRIGKMKSDQGSEVRDPDRERRLLGQRLDWSRSLDMPADLVTELFELIMKHSKEVQKK